MVLEAHLRGKYFGSGRPRTALSNLQNSVREAKYRLRATPNSCPSVIPVGRGRSVQSSAAQEPGYETPDGKGSRYWPLQPLQADHP